MSRDNVVGFSMWAILVWGALSAWSGYFTLVTTPDMLASVLFSLLILSLLSPGLLWMTNKIRPVGLDVLRIHPLPGVTLLLFSGSAIFHTLSRTIRPNRFIPIAGFALAMASAGLIGWLFYSRRKLNDRTTLITATWVTLLLSCLQAVRLAYEQGQTSGFVMTGIVLGIIGVLPALALTTGSRHWAHSTYKRLSRLPYGVLATGPLTALVLLIAYKMGDQSAALFVLLRLFTLVGVVGLSLFLARLIESDSTASTHDTDRAPNEKVVVWLIVIGLIYAILAIRGISLWMGGNTPDSFAYLQMARHFAAGEIVGRGLWPPFMSMLIAPFMAVGVDPEVSQRWMVGANGLVWMIMVWSLSGRMALPTPARLGVTALTGAWAIQYTFWPLTPDFLAATTLLGYFLLVTHPRFTDKPILFGVLTGLVGAICYLTRYFFLPYVLAHIMLTVLWLVWHDRPLKKAAAGAAASLVTFALAALPWIIVLSIRYGTPTFSTSGDYNHAWLGPIARYQPICWTGGLCDQPEDVLFPWEDPDEIYYRAYAWSMFDSPEYFRYQITQTRDNIQSWTSRMVDTFGIVLPVGGLGLIVALFRNWHDPTRRFWPGFLLYSVILFTGGYFLSNSAELRYYYPLFMIFGLGVYSSVGWLIERVRRTDQFRTGMRRLIVPSLVVLPALSLIVSGGVERLDYFDCLGPDSRALTPSLRAPMAGIGAPINAVSYYTQTRTYGELATGISTEEAHEELEAHGIASVIGAEDNPIVQGLISVYGYHHEGTYSVCDDSYAILYVP